MLNFFVTLTSSKVLPLEKAQENLGFFLAYSYLCRRNSLNTLFNNERITTEVRM